MVVILITLLKCLKSASSRSSKTPTWNTRTAFAVVSRTWKTLGILTCGSTSSVGNSALPGWPWWRLRWFSIDNKVVLFTYFSHGVHRKWLQTRWRRCDNSSLKKASTVPNSPPCREPRLICWSAASVASVTALTTRCCIVISRYTECTL